MDWLLARLCRFSRSSRGSITLTTEATLAFVMIGASVAAIEVGMRAECHNSGGARSYTTAAWSCADLKNCSSAKKFELSTSSANLQAPGLSGRCASLAGWLTENGDGGGDGEKGDDGKGSKCDDKDSEDDADCSRL